MSESRLSPNVAAATRVSSGLKIQIQKNAPVAHGLLSRPAAIHPRQSKSRGDAAAVIRQQAGAADRERSKPRVGKVLRWQSHRETAHRSAVSFDRSKLRAMSCPPLRNSK